MYEKNLESEKKYLDFSLKKFESIENFTRKRLTLLPTMYKEDPFQLADLIYRHEKKLDLIKKLYDKPYFARIDFVDQNNIYEKCYIGKIGLADEENKIITVDWRAPIASMYYDSNIGNASYDSPSGVINGTLQMKRQFNIENGKILSFQDVDDASNDEMLKPYLNASADNRLKNIVSTIQEEQNNIIRESINKNIIVQGVAGSGKTTVALHRIAYLVYNNIDKYKPEQYLVIGPNKFFINYISGVLPDLDVSDAKQLTYFEIVCKLLNENLELLSDDKKLADAVNNKDMSNDKFRNSLEYKNIIDDFINDYIKNIIPPVNFSYKGYDILSNLVVEKLFEEAESDSEILSVKMDKFYSRFARFINEKNARILYTARNYYYNNIDLDPSKKNLNSFEKEIKNKCNTSIRNYMKKAKPNILTLYISFLETLRDSNETYYKKVITNIRRKKVEFEDLAALMYFYYRFYGCSNFSDFKHTVIDEAQDLGVFNFYALRKIMPKSTFSIFGDISQSIYSYRSMNNWNEIVDLNYENINVKYLEKSYRTTIEIMQEANYITRHLQLTEAKPVLRHGVDVKYTKTNNKYDDITNILNEYVKKEYKSIAIICKDENESNEVYDYIFKTGIILSLITDNNVEYNGGICVITSYLAKGLEFDGVIISDASSNVYLEDRKIDLKLLYVAMTRALHELTLCYSSNLLSIFKKDNL